MALPLAVGMGDLRALAIRFAREIHGIQIAVVLMGPWLPRGSRIAPFRDLLAGLSRPLRGDLLTGLVSHARCAGARLCFDGVQ